MRLESSLNDEHECEHRRSTQFCLMAAALRSEVSVAVWEIRVSRRDGIRSMNTGLAHPSSQPSFYPKTLVLLPLSDMSRRDLLVLVMLQVLLSRFALVGSSSSTFSYRFLHPPSNYHGSLENRQCKCYGVFNGKAPQLFLEQLDTETLPELMHEATGIFLDCCCLSQTSLPRDYSLLTTVAYC